jgi:hypothetical protein
MYKKISKERTDLILRLYDEGKNASQIRKETGHSSSTVNKILHIHRGEKLYPSSILRGEQKKKTEERKEEFTISCISSIQKALAFWEKTEEKARTFVLELRALLDLADEAESKNKELNEILAAFDRNDREKTELRESINSLKRTNAGLQERINAFVKTRAYQNATLSEKSLNENKS